MGCNPDEGSLREINDNFPMNEALKKGYTEIFKIGEMVKIRNCYFEVNNFVEAHSFMNLKLLKNEEALKRLAQLIPAGEILQPKKFWLWTKHG